MVTNMKMTKAGQKKVGKVMGEYKEGTLHSGKGGKVVSNPKQAVAIALSSAETVKCLLEDNADNVSKWLTLVAEGDELKEIRPDPYKALDMLAKLAEYATPKLARTELTGSDNKPIEISVTWAK